MATSAKYVAYRATKGILLRLLREVKVSRSEFSNVKNYSQTVYYLKKSGMIGVKNDEIYLKVRGKKKALEYSIEELAINKKIEWDGKWRIVLFDIPEKQKYLRHIFKSKLDQLGFVLYQKSTYIMPFECDQEIKLLEEIYGIKSYVKIILAEKIEDDLKYLKKFELNKGF